MNATAAARTVSLLTVVLAAGALPAAAQRSPLLATTRLEADVLTQACAPVAAVARPTSTLHITGGQDTQVRDSFVQGNFVTLDAGTRQGLKVGQEFFVRRLIVPRGADITVAEPGVTRTAGWVRVHAVDDDLALATITYSCDTMRVGDYLEPLTLPTPVVPGPLQGKPERDSYGKVLLGNEGRFEFAAGDSFVIDRGSANGVAPGTQFVVYRWKRKAPENFLVPIADAVAISVKAETATLSVTNARDAVTINDLVAVRK